MEKTHLDPDTHPEFEKVTVKTISRAVKLGVADYINNPQYGLLISGICAIIGIKLLFITLASGTTYWLVLSIFAFPIVAPFSAVGLYEISRQKKIIKINNY